MTLSRFTYRYRDANNFKIQGEFLLKGVLTLAQICEVKALLFEDEWFVPEQLGLPPLQVGLYHYSNGPTDADHPLHEFVELSECEDACHENTDKLMDSLALLARFRAVGGEWDHIFNPTL
jgi:hypothetical protein